MKKTNEKKFCIFRKDNDISSDMYFFNIKDIPEGIDISWDGKYDARSIAFVDSVIAEYADNAFQVMTLHESYEMLDNERIGYICHVDKNEHVYKILVIHKFNDCFVIEEEERELGIKEYIPVELTLMSSNGKSVAVAKMYDYYITEETFTWLPEENQNEQENEFEDDYREDPIKDILPELKLLWVCTYFEKMSAILYVVNTKELVVNAWNTDAVLSKDILSNKEYRAMLESAKTVMFEGYGIEEVSRHKRLLKMCPNIHTATLNFMGSDFDVQPINHKIFDSNPKLEKIVVMGVLDILGEKFCEKYKNILETKDPDNFDDVFKCMEWF